MTLGARRRADGFVTRWNWSRHMVFLRMNTSVDIKLPADLAAELEAKYFWWESVGSVPRSDARILAQAMDLASFEDIRRLETIVGVETLADFMQNTEPGWISERSWELWRGRLALATGRPIPQRPPRRVFDAAKL